MNCDVRTEGVEPFPFEVFEVRVVGRSGTWGRMYIQSGMCWGEGVFNL